MRKTSKSSGVEECDVDEEEKEEKVDEKEGKEQPQVKLEMLAIIIMTGLSKAKKVPQDDYHKMQGRIVLQSLTSHGLLVIPD
ncbi:hypothetical protein PoB_001096000 [Plakobranchus ocellatus]|uniref:MAGE domain-containing protein n=1 Tax=Plakobranchus ocellatus TaxID=259542 RepID=A0AAV3YMZ6_9GAST|nr:hypothetical protein PoB_001096000 [Plakobranchus ocellatus]